MADGGEFTLIVTGVDSARLADASGAFAKAFSLDGGIAQQICKSAPIIFAQNLNKTEVKAITNTLKDLSRLGLEFRVTARVGAKLPKVNWPVRPQFTAGGAAGVNGLAFAWDNNAFVCPGCGETFLFRRLGQLKLVEPPAPAPAPAPKASSRPVAPAPLTLADEPASEPQIEGLEGVEPVAGEGESLDLPSPSLSDDFPDPLADISIEPLPDLSMDASESLLEDLGEAPQVVPLEESVPAPAQEVAVEEIEGPALQGELYNVFLSKITDGSKRDKAADLISQVKGCSPPEAKELTTRLVIPLAKNVPKERAEEILNSFKKLKIFGRMTKVK